MSNPFLYDGMGNKFKRYGEGPDDAGDLSTWSEDFVVKKIVADNLDAAAARALAARWVLLSTGLAPASVEFLRHVAAILLAVEQHRQQELRKTFQKPDPPQVDPDSVRLDSRVRDYAARHRTTYDAAFQVIMHDPAVAKAYTRTPNR